MRASPLSFDGSSVPSAVRLSHKDRGLTVKDREEPLKDRGGAIEGSDKQRRVIEQL